MTNRYTRSRKTPEVFKDRPPGRVNFIEGVYIGFVKDNRDAQRMGRLQVWIPEMGTEPDDRSGWYTVSYCSPFAGATNPRDLSRTNTSSFEGTQKSYGFWMVPPDLENQVVVMFAGGDPARGLWMGCLYHQLMNHMVPGNANSRTFNEPDTRSLPGAEYNKNAPNTINFNNIVRPTHTPFAQGLSDQGLLGDEIRGTSQSSARREAPSEVFGVITPGPKSSDGRTRLGGHQFVMDDNSSSEFIRLRTRSGAQILINETNGMIYMINKRGTAWIELADDGNVDVYGLQNISFRAEGDFNIRADGNVNIESGQNVNIKAAANVSDGNIVADGSGSGGDVNINALGNFNFRAQNNTALTAVDGRIDVKAGTSGNYTSGDDTNILAGGNILETAVAIHLNGPDAAEADDAGIIETIRKIDVLGNRSEVAINTITSRFLTLEPCPEHDTTVIGLQSGEQDRSINLPKNAVDQNPQQPLSMTTPDGKFEGESYNARADGELDPVFTRVGDSDQVDPLQLSLSQAGEAFIVRHEGNVLSIYLDQGGLPHIGVGHLLTAEERRTNRIVLSTGEVLDISDRKITREESLKLFRDDAKRFENAVRRNVRTPLNQNQFDALVSWVLNVGEGRIRPGGSTLISVLNQGEYGQVPSELMKWVNVAGRPSRGLRKRREQEARLFSGEAVV